MDSEQNKLVDELLRELESDNLAIFAGAGLSRGAGYVDWKMLLQPIADDLGLDIDQEHDLVALAQYHENISKNRSKLNSLLIDQFSDLAKPTENHAILARLPISTYWTTNYDHLIEDALRGAGKTSDRKFTPEQMTTTVRKRDAVIYKMHGDSEHPANAVLTRDDYETYHKKMKPFLNALTGDLTSKTFLFLGFSFTDPNIEHILGRVRVAYGRNQRQSYCILGRVRKRDDESQADFEYRKRKQELFDSELRRVAVKAVYVESYDQITEILRALEFRYRKRSVFISGAAHSYAPYEEKESERAVFELSKAISQRGYRIISGFGLGIGSAVIAGVVEATAYGRKALDEDRLVVRPFPQSQPGEMTRAQLWSHYRNDMIRRAGVAIFLFGNKLDDAGRIVLSDGMREEFRLALEHGLLILPIGITGYVASELWQEVMSMINSGEIQLAPQIVSLVEELGSADTTFERARDVVLEILAKN